MTKKTLFTIAAVSVLCVGIVGVTVAFAQTQTAGQTSVPSLVQEIANKFNLNPSDVQSVFIQHRQEVQSKQEANYEKYLTNLVKEGKITQAQEQLLLNKHNELINQMQRNMKNFKTMTPAKRQALMQSAQQDLQNWAKQNNINVQYLRPFGPGMRRFGGFGWHKPTSTPTP